MTDPYAPLAAVYDDWQETSGAFWPLALPRLQAALPPETDSFLELGCGTGSLVLALRQRHPTWRLAGADGSEAMLARARAKPGADTVDWHHAPFGQRLDVAPFSAAGAFFDAVNHVPPAALAPTFAAVAAALRPGAPFLFDVNDRLGFEVWWRDRRVHPCAGFTLVIDATFDGEQAVARTSVHHHDPRGTVRTTEIREWCFRPDDIASALDGAGFTVEEASPWSPRPDDIPGKTWWVARRR